MNLKDKYNNNIILNLIKIYILTYGQFLVTGTPVTQAARIREVLLYFKGGERKGKREIRGREGRGGRRGGQGEEEERRAGREGEEGGRERGRVGGRDNERGGEGGRGESERERGEILKIKM